MVQQYIAAGRPCGPVSWTGRRDTAEGRRAAASDAVVDTAAAVADAVCGVREAQQGLADRERVGAGQGSEHLPDQDAARVLATLVQTSWTVIAQGAQGLRDHELLDVATSANAQTSRQLTWLNTRMKTAASQALIIAP